MVLEKLVLIIIWVKKKSKQAAVLEGSSKEEQNGETSP